MTDKSTSPGLITGYLFAAGATAIWSGNFIVARGLSDAIPPVTLAFCRWFVACTVLSLFALPGLKKEWRVIRGHLPYLSITAFLGITTFNTLIYIAGHSTTALNLALIAITFPIFIILFSRILYNEKLTLLKICGIVLVLFGVLLLTTKGKPSALLSISFNRGDLWMLAASVIFAVYSLLVKKKPEEISIMSFQLSTFLLGLVFLFPFFILEYSQTAEPFLNRTTIPSILYVGIFASLCAFILWNKSIVELGPSKAGMVYYTLPLFSGLLGHLFLGESVNMLHFYSTILILAGIVMANRP